MSRRATAEPSPRGTVTRRSLVRAAAMGPMVGSLGATAGRRPHVAVIGAGAFGGWTALSLLRRGAKVTLFDAWGPGH